MKKSKTCRPAWTACCCVLTENWPDGSEATMVNAKCCPAVSGDCWPSASASISGFEAVVGCQIVLPYNQIEEMPDVQRAKIVATAWLGKS